MNPTSDPAPAGHPPLAIGLILLLRPHQWVKNLLLFVPILLNHRQHDAADLYRVMLAFGLFCLVASAGYVVNDVGDRAADRHHPRKRRRPIASGAVSPAAGLGLAGAMLVAAFALAVWLLPLSFMLVLGIYLAMTVLYSLWLKTRLLVDVFVLAGLYTLRLLAGGAAAGIELTAWLLAFSMFIFLSLAFAKRYAELDRAGTDTAEHLKARDYRQEDKAILLSAGPACGYLAVLVMAIYISSEPAQRLYNRPELLWLVCPVLLYWITRVWFLARRGAMNEDPIVFALRDPISWTAGVLAVGLVVAAAVM